MMAGYSFGDAVRMEWVKLRTLRSTTWVLGAGMCVTIALGMVAGFNTRSATGDPTSNVLAGIVFGQVVTGVLGVLTMTAEYSSGLIRPTLAAVPRRSRVLWAKACVLGGLTLAAGQITAFASFFGGIAVLRSTVPHPALTAGPVLRAVIMTGAYFAIVSLTGLGVGAIIRHGAAAVAILVGGLFVLPIVTPGARGAARFMPELIAGNSLAAVKPVAGFAWSPWLELAIAAAYPAVLLAAGGVLLIRRDA
jgi:ABC-2 type transport system permease protein